MKEVLVFDDFYCEKSFKTESYVFSCVDEVGDLVVTCDCLSDEHLAKLYFALFNEMNSRLSVDKFLSYFSEEELVKLFSNQYENILFANK